MKCVALNRDVTRIPNSVCTWWRIRWGCCLCGWWGCQRAPGRIGCLRGHSRRRQMWDRQSVASCGLGPLLVDQAQSRCRCRSSPAMCTPIQHIAEPLRRSGGGIWIIRFLFEDLWTWDWFCPIKAATRKIRDPTWLRAMTSKTVWLLLLQLTVSDLWWWRSSSSRQISTSVAHFYLLCVFLEMLIFQWSSWDVIKTKLLLEQTFVIL